MILTAAASDDKHTERCSDNTVSQRFSTGDVDRSVVSAWKRRLDCGVDLQRARMRSNNPTLIDIERHPRVGRSEIDPQCPIHLVVRYAGTSRKALRIEYPIPKYDSKESWTHLETGYFFPSTTPHLEHRLISQRAPLLPLHLPPLLCLARSRSSHISTDHTSRLCSRDVRLSRLFRLGGV